MRATRSNSSWLSTRVCDYDWQRSTYQLKRLIRCAARRWDVAGGPDKAVRVARCESRFDPEAYNPGGYAGVSRPRSSNACCFVSYTSTLTVFPCRCVNTCTKEKTTSIPVWFARPPNR